MKILITGGSGFVGTNLAAYLAARGHELVAVGRDRRGATVFSNLFTWDQLDRIDWAGVDAVIHLAGKAHDTRNTTSPQAYFDVNVGLTQIIVDACVRSGGTGPKAFVLFSSVKAVADRVDDMLCEDAVPSPHTPYGKSKLEAEKVVRTAFAGESSATRSYILRPCMIHGPGNKGNLNRLYRIVQQGVPWPFGAFENRRSFASIGNVCAAVEALLATHAPAGVYQVADDEPLATNDVVRLIAESLDREPRIWRVPASLVRAVARTGDLLHLPLDSERLKKLTESYVVSNEKLKHALAWQRMPVEARDGLRQTLASFAGER
ncbi:MAG: NAD-dependent epimerase/dehydratase family protein [Planctomycetia bacterium]|jgi:nucleoside-diphosphate-sugar epimerase